jgi:hypothetical protein
MKITKFTLLVGLALVGISTGCSQPNCTKTTQVTFDQQRMCARDGEAYAKFATNFDQPPTLGTIKASPRGCFAEYLTDGPMPASYHGNDYYTLRVYNVFTHEEVATYSGLDGHPGLCIVDGSPCGKTIMEGNIHVFSEKVKQSFGLTVEF